MLRGKLAAAVLVGGIVLAGCQSVPEAAIDAQAFNEERLNDPVRAVGPGGQLVVEAGEFFFDLEEGVAVDGDIEVTLDNTGGALHNFRIDAATGDNVKVEAAAGETATGTLNLFAGEYTFYCDVPGHRSAGMEGTLTVYRSEEEATPVGQQGDGS
ncbi:MAG: plastocyanin/azurin family copper-binding protein [Nitriliruptorales bacterium]|nr:plastocyanin/azurin family copper-binding protein [Nitriliruptorales bacterium]